VRPTLAPPRYSQDHHRHHHHSRYMCCYCFCFCSQVSENHLLVIPRKKIESWKECSPEDLDLLRAMKDTAMEVRLVCLCPRVMPMGRAEGRAEAACRLPC